MWPIGVFLTTAIAGGVYVVLQPRLGAALMRPVTAYASIAVLALVAIQPSRHSDYWPATAFESGVGERLLDQMRSNLRQLPDEGPIVISSFWGVGVDDFNYIMLTEFQRTGVEFVFPEDSPNVRRFGEDRCMSGNERWRLRTEFGRPLPQPRRGEKLLAAVDLLPPDEAAELDALDARFGDALRAGLLTIDPGLVAYIGRTMPPDLDRVIATAGRPATGLATPISALEVWGTVTIDESVRDDWRRWVELETRARNTARRLSPHPQPPAAFARLPMTAAHATASRATMLP